MSLTKLDWRHCNADALPRPCRAGGWALAVSICAVAGCAHSPTPPAPSASLVPQELATAEPSAQMLAASEKLQRVAYRLKAGASAWCGQRVHAETGLSFWLGPPDTTQASAGGPAARPPQVLHVAEGSAAATAGIQSKDQVTAVDGAVVADGPTGLVQLHDWLARLAAAPRPAALTLNRNGAVLDAQLMPRSVCDFSVVLDRDMAQRCRPLDGRTVQVSMGMVQATQDGDLAFAIAHGASHGLLHHTADRAAARYIANVVDAPFFVFGVAMAIASMGAYPEALAMPMSSLNDRRVYESELQADRWALYMVNAAGFASASPRTPIFDDLESPSNPSPRWRERLAALEKIMVRIDSGQGGHPPRPTDEDVADLAARVGISRTRQPGSPGAAAPPSVQSP